MLYGYTLILSTASIIKIEKKKKSIKYVNNNKNKVIKVFIFFSLLRVEFNRTDDKNDIRIELQ